ncbi:hypothetical protein [Pseudoalteromonas sp. T1lg48]|uniref:hypothetical protein n=1 Tax=Pseudoalteromonas sp. T1lg48 TaxID=2077100 RepID=UPI000CF74216|nr:hypothetical protein [Pseudoalteromonas sp. T1lg48]
MTRRYLTIDEAVSALNRGKEVEAFLGGFIDGENASIKWVSFEKNCTGFIAKVWQSLDEGSVDYLDIYGFTPSNGEWDEPLESHIAENLSDLIAKLSAFEIKLVNYGIVQDEYGDYKAQNS